MKYAIPEVNIESLEKKLTKIRNKCAKYGCEFKYERTGEHFEERSFKDDRGVVRKEMVKYIDVDVDGRAAVNGWRFAASLEYTDKGNIISGVGIEIPDRYYTCSPWCEHCKTRRDRKSSYIVYNEETGEFKQVGRGCLRDFTGGLSAEAVAQFESWFKEAEEASEFSGFGGWGSSYYNVKDFMVCVAETIRVFGYVKRDAVGMLATADLADILFRVENNMRCWGDSRAWREMYDDAVDRGFDTKRADSIELAGTVREWIGKSDRTDNYFHNLKVACALECCERSAVGLLASAFPAYNRELEYESERREREAKEKEAAAKSSWMGEVGDKVAFEIADFRVISSWETQWGWTSVYKFVDTDGREATWKTSNYVDEHCVGGTIKGSVKELKEYRGIKQTELTRCKVTMPKKVEKKHAEYNDAAERAFDDFMAYCDGKVG